LTGSLAAIAWQQGIGVTRARWLAVTGVVVMLLGESTLAPLAIAPALLDEQIRRIERKTNRFGWFAWMCLGLILVWMAVAPAIYQARTGARLSLNIWAGTKRAVWLLLVAPIRLFFPTFSLAGRERVAPIFGIALIVLLFVAVRRFRSSKNGSFLFRIAALTAIGPLAYLQLVGLGRSRFSYLELYQADRYFFPLLIPWSLFGGALAVALSEASTDWSRERRRLFGATVLALTAIFALTQRQALAQHFPRDVFEIHEHRFRQVSQLAGLLADTG